MKTNIRIYIGLLLACSLATAPAIDRFVSLDGGHVPPFTSWADAATNIQAAIDAASAGDTVWVTNGVYSTGGKVMAGDLTNRVALDKALTVRSANGPFATVIQGNGPFTGNTSVRCAWLTNGATLQGFTLTGGGTRSLGDILTLRSGGGAWCSSSNAVLANCVIVTNVCVTYGGGVYQGTLRNCFISRNASEGAYAANLVNCTVISNSSWGIFNCRATNSIIAYHTTDLAGSSSLTYSCTLSFVPGIGNVVGSPRLMPDGIHLSNDSPCRFSGTNVTAGADIDGEAWSNPPSIGCDQWQPSPLIVGAPQVQITTYPPGFSIRALVSGEEPMTCWWLRDATLIDDDGHYQNTHTTNLLAAGILPSDAGAYRVIVSNAFGVATSAVANLTFRFVNVANLTPAPPFNSWATAATNIQHAIDAAAAGEVVFVTNGVYATGGKIKAGDLTNRVALDKALLVQSVNGPAATIIQGVWDPVTTNGPLAVRCAWLTNGATLSGFTLRGGATRNSGDFISQRGGGVWCSSDSATLLNCEIVDNYALTDGGGAYYGTLVDCVISNNATLLPNINGGGGVAYSTLRNCRVTRNSSASVGGGAREATLYNCAVTLNSATSGGGCHQSRLDNCTVSRNSARFSGGGVYWAGSSSEVFARNCIIWNNEGSATSPNYSGGRLTNSCTFPLPSGAGNISTDPQLLADGFHLAASSPCRNAGNPLYATGTDIDGQDWESPPAMGCDQWHPEPLVAVEPLPRPALGNGHVRISTVTAGQEPIQYAWSKDGLPLANDGHYTNTQSASLLIRDFGVGDSGTYQVVASNAFGVVTSQVVQVTVHCVSSASAAPAMPYTTWESAATAIQDAVDVAGPNDVILVTNGVYANGGRTKSGALTNRVVIDKPVLVTSVNGPDSTIIQGQWDPTSTNGPASVRCVWLADGAALSGFTLRDGATTKGGNGTFDGSGGGVLCSSTNAELANCVITNCAAWFSAGGALYGTLDHCTLVGNSLVAASAGGGGGAEGSFLVNCLIKRNTAVSTGGGVQFGRLYNCAVVENSAGFAGGGAYFGRMVNCTVAANRAAVSGGGIGWVTASNCIVYLNTAPRDPNITAPNGNYFTCSTPMPIGTGNISNDPQLTDGWHLSATSPCRGMGSSSAATGTDLDGNPWATPPSMGCDEVYEAELVGPLSVSLSAAYPEVATYGSLPLRGLVSGRASRLEWSFGEGTSFTNLSALTFNTWTNAGDYLVTFTAYNTDNPGGVSTSMMVHVVPLVSPQLTASGLSSNNFTLSFPGQAGITYVVEQATNLAPPATWQTVQALISTGGLMQVTDTRATNAMRFYRTRMQ